MPTRRTAAPLLALLATAALVACVSAERPPSHRRRLNDDSRSVSFVVSQPVNCDCRASAGRAAGVCLPARWLQHTAVLCQPKRHLAEAGCRPTARLAQPPCLTSCSSLPPLLPPFSGPPMAPPPCVSRAPATPMACCTPRPRPTSPRAPTPCSLATPLQTA